LYSVEVGLGSSGCSKSGKDRKSHKHSDKEASTFSSAGERLTVETVDKSVKFRLKKFKDKNKTANSDENDSSKSESVTIQRKSRKTHKKWLYPEKLQEYLLKIDPSSHPSPLCLLCKLYDHSTKHLFNCPMIRTSFTTGDLWSNPVAVANLLQLWTDTPGAAGGGARSGVAWKNRPQTNRRRAIFSQAVIVKHSPLGDLFTIAVFEKIAPRRFIHDRGL